MTRILIASAAILLMTGFAMADVVRLGTEGAYPPYNFVNAEGKVDGFERELGDELCKRAKMSCEWVVRDWDSIIENLLSGDFDAIMAAMSITGERDKRIDFSQNYTLPDPSAYIVASREVDLKAAHVGAQSGTIQAAYLESSGALVLKYSTPEKAIEALRTGDVGAVLADRTYLDQVAEENPGLMLLDEVVMIGSGAALGLRETDRDLMDRFNAAISSMKADGSLNALIRKWKIGQTF